MVHPFHAYWDDFWAVRGFKDAAEMAELLGETDQAHRIATLRDAFGETLYDSLDRVIAERGIDFIPGSVEFADFDPSATAIAIAEELRKLPHPAIEQTFEKYLIGFRERTRPDADWANDTADEIRIIAALVRLGRRRKAHELLDFLLADRRIQTWNQWPKISCRAPLGPSFIGDMPHSWIGAEYWRSAPYSPTNARPITAWSSQPGYRGTGWRTTARSGCGIYRPTMAISASVCAGRPRIPSV